VQTCAANTRKLPLARYRAHISCSLLCRAKIFNQHGQGVAKKFPLRMLTQKSGSPAKTTLNAPNAPSITMKTSRSVPALCNAHPAAKTTRRIFSCAGNAGVGWRLLGGAIPESSIGSATLSPRATLLLIRLLGRSLSSCNAPIKQ